MRVQILKEHYRTRYGQELRRGEIVDLPEHIAVKLTNFGLVSRVMGKALEAAALPDEPIEDEPADEAPDEALEEEPAEPAPPKLRGRPRKA